MKFSLILIACFTLAITAFGDLKKIQGTWKPSAGQIGDKPLPKALLDKMILKIDGVKYDYDEGHGHDIGTLKEVAGKPLGLDIVGTEGPNKGKTYLTIYKIDGKTLTICYGLDGKRPKSFDEKGKMQMLITYRLSE